MESIIEDEEWIISGLPEDIDSVLQVVKAGVQRYVCKLNSALPDDTFEELSASMKSKHNVQLKLENGQIVIRGAQSKQAYMELLNILSIL